MARKERNFQGPAVVPRIYGQCRGVARLIHTCRACPHATNTLPKCFSMPNSWWSSVALQPCTHFATLPDQPKHMRVARSAVGLARLLERAGRQRDGGGGGAGLRPAERGRQGGAECGPGRRDSQVCCRVRAGGQRGSRARACQRVRLASARRIRRNCAVLVMCRA